MGWMFGLYFVNSILMFIIAIREVRRPTRALTGIAIGLVIPILGYLLYFVMSKRVPRRRHRLMTTQNEVNPLLESFSHSALVIARSLHRLSVHGLRTGKVQVLNGGIETYASLIESLEKARRTIDIEFYIYRNDQISRLITDLLIERAAAGVQVRFLRDGLGGRQLPRDQIERMMKAGISCRTFFPLRFPKMLPTLNYRDHCKIVVIDTKESFTGGINIGDEYTGLKPNVGFWRDTHVRILGEVAVDLKSIFKAHWKMATPEPRSKRPAKPKVVPSPMFATAGDTSNRPLLSRIAVAGFSTEMASDLGKRELFGMGQHPIRDTYIQTLEGNPGIPTQVVRQTYFICLTQAAQSIDITTPYFIPDADIIMALKTAVARGVRVRLLVPHRVDHKIVGAASRTYYGELVEAGVDIHLYDKGILHAKAMIIDDEVAVLGAANFDMRSFRLDYEVCEVMYSTDVARDLTEQFERDLAHSIPLRISDLEGRSIPQRLLEQSARLLAPLL